MLLSSLIISNCQDHVLCFCLSIQPECRVLHSSSINLSSLSSLLNRSAVWNHSYPLCHSYNCFRGSVLLISSSIIPSSQVHVNSFHFLPVCFHINIDPLSSCFMSFNLQGSLNVPCSSC